MFRDGKCEAPLAACPSGQERNADGKCVKPATTTAPCKDGEVRTLRGCEKPAKPAPILKTTAPLKLNVKPPPKLNVKPPPKLNLAPKPIVVLKPPSKKR
jgi:hypothetical protein